MKPLSRLKEFSLFLIFLSCVAMIYPEIRVPQDDFVPGWRRAEHKKVFARKELFNYIDGGAELFLEFGFDNLVIQRYQKGNSELTLEAYQTESPESALGIYLVKC